MACEQVHSSRCTQRLLAAHQELARFASHTRVLHMVPVLNEIPSILSSQAELLLSAATIQACFVDCSDADLSKIANDAHHRLANANTALSQSRLWRLVSSQLSSLASYHHTLHSLQTFSDAIQPLFPHLSELLGQNKPITYRILLQNNKEIRPSGGFMGSYATLTLDKTRIIDVHVEDIYVPDGQIKGYVEEPYGIRHYLFAGDHPGWRLRDSNWHPDFPTAAQSINWFFAEGQEKPADILVALNLSTVEKVLDLVGPIPVLDYDVTIDSQNMYAITQAQAEANFFPGSTQKGDFLRSLSDSFAAKLARLPVAKGVEVATLLLDELSRREIMISAQEPSVAQAVRLLGWDGSLPEVKCDAQGCTPLVLGIVEANVGSTKANCCIARQFSDTITFEDERVTHELALQFANTSLPKPEPPYHFGGGYKNYLRLLLPKDVLVTSVAIDGVLLDAYDIDHEAFAQYVFWGFLHQVEGGQTSTVSVRLEVANKGNKPDSSLTLLKQPGIPSVPWKLTHSNGQASSSQSLTLSQTTSLSLPLLP